MLSLVWKCMLGPRLYKVYRDGTDKILYEAQGLERWGDNVIYWTNALFKIGLYTSPFICMYIYKRGFFSYEEGLSIAHYMSGIGFILAISFVLRSIGRTNSLQYVEFIKTLSDTTTDQTTYIKNIRKYDFESEAWPISYSVSATQRQHPVKTQLSCANSDLPLYQRSFIQVLAYIATHTFALRLIYPGSLGLLNSFLWLPLMQGRTNLVEQFNGKRSRIRTADGNAIDTMFVDNRKNTSKGDILMVCCEGNSGFYEIGIMITPIKSGYSAVGWNHPGFAGSTGLPYPDQELNAIDAVMQYAINELGFKPEKIIMYGWSIGGYPAVWAATNYSVRALILDATFDDLLPLAENQMPRSWKLLVKEVVRCHVDLNVAEQLSKYSGPVQMVRRTEDEIICLRQGIISSNRGNNLLLSLLENRHSDALAALQSEGDQEFSVRAYIDLLETQRTSLANNFDEKKRKSLRLVTRYMTDYKSSHCTILPVELLNTIMSKIDAQLKEY